MSTASSDHVRVADLAEAENAFLDGMRPQPSPTATVFRRIACPTCDKAFAPVRIITGHPTFEKRSQQFVVVRRLYCDHCRQIIRWWEICDKDGRLLGQPLNADGDFTFVRDQKTIATFLRCNPQAVCQEEA